MANVIDILIKANTTQATSSLKQFGGSVNQVVQGLTGFSLSGLTVTAGLVAIGNELKKAVNEYSDYATAIGKAAEISGVTAEEMSRLAQAADGVFVSQDALTRSFQMALKNGFVPTIENLAKLSDELLAITDPAQRAEKAAKIFGSGWAEIAPFILQGGDAIREGTATIEDGLIVTDQAIKQNIKYKQQIDALNDSVTALKNTLVSGLIPVMAGSLKIFNDNIAALRAGIPLWEVLRNNQAQYAALEAQVAFEAGKMGVGFRDVGAAIVEITPSIGDINSAISDTSGAASAAQGALTGYNSLLGQIAGLNDDIASAQQNLNDAQASWQAGAGNDTRSLLEQQGLKGDALIIALGGVDDVMGTSLATQEDYNQNLEKAVKEFGKSKDLDAFKEALTRIKDEFMPLDEKVKAATDSVQILQDKLDLMNGMKVNIEFVLTTSGSMPSVPGVSGYSDYIGGSGGGNSGVGTPAGGGTTTPPTTKPPGYIGMDSATPTIIINAGGYSQTDAGRLAAQVASALQRRR